MFRFYILFYIFNVTLSEVAGIVTDISASQMIFLRSIYYTKEGFR